MSTYVYTVGLISITILVWLYVVNSERHKTIEEDHTILRAQQWEWIETRYPDGSLVAPQRQGVFVFNFETDDRVHITTDCNSMSGTYLLQTEMFTFSELATTLMYCEDSQEHVFSSMLNIVYRYAVDGDEFRLDLEDGGVMYFQSVNERTDIQ